MSINIDNIEKDIELININYQENILDVVVVYLITTLMVELILFG